MPIDETLGGVGVAVFEEARRHLGTAAGHAYGGYLAQLTAWAEANRIPYQGVPVGTIKRHIAGKGNADKAAVIEIGLAGGRSLKVPSSLPMADLRRLIRAVEET